MLTFRHKHKQDALQSKSRAGDGMGNIFRWLGDKIAAAYRFVWDFILCRQEPFTYQLSRMMVRHGIFFWAGFMWIVGKLWNNLFNACAWWEALLNIAGLVFMCWLVDHLVDTVRLHDPEYYNG